MMCNSLNLKSRTTNRKYLLNDTCCPYFLFYSQYIERNRFQNEFEVKLILIHIFII